MEVTPPRTGQVAEEAGVLWALTLDRTLVGQAGLAFPHLLQAQQSVELAGVAEELTPQVALPQLAEELEGTILIRLPLAQQTRAEAGAVLVLQTLVTVDQVV